MARGNTYSVPSTREFPLQGCRCASAYRASVPVCGQTTLLVTGDDLGAAVGPVLGYALLQAGLPASAVLGAQSIVHGCAAAVAFCTARAATHGPAAVDPNPSVASMALRTADSASEDPDRLYLKGGAEGERAEAEAPGGDKGRR